MEPPRLPPAPASPPAPANPSRGRVTQSDIARGRSPPERSPACCRCPGEFNSEDFCNFSSRTSRPPSGNFGQSRGARGQRAKEQRVQPGGESRARADPRAQTLPPKSRRSAPPTPGQQHGPGGGSGGSEGPQEGGERGDEARCP